MFKPPAVNPKNGKALSVPLLNPIDKYGRTLYFSTFGFMVAFLSWYAFQPLLTKTIRKDLHLSQAEVANSNIMGQVATLVVRLIVGPLCDRYGPRLVFAGVLLCGAIPTALAGTVTNATGLLILRFFVGILGASFVPCQVWSTGFYDNTVVGTANALMAGIGNAGGGVTYFVMPALFDSLVEDRGLDPSKAWRVAFTVPFIMITATAAGIILLCEDMPTGPWAERHKRRCEKSVVEKSDLESSGSEGMVEITASEIVQNPTIGEAMTVVFSLQCLSLAAPYACSFGGELALNSVLGAYYAKSFPDLGQTKSGRWAAMFGLLNVVFRPAGGVIADIIYRTTNFSVTAKRLWLTFLSVIMGCFCVTIGVLDSHHKSTMFSLIATMSFFMDAANGANFAVVPHVFPFANGVLSGVVGATGNLGGMLFSIVFRYNGVHYGRSIWICGAVMIVINLGVAWIKPAVKK